MSFAGARVLITGGLGFIGSNLARRLLAQGAAVTVIDNLNPEYGGNRANVSDIADKLVVHIGDVRDASLMGPLLERCEFLFNLAAQTSHLGSMQQPLVDLEINATAQLSLLEQCRQRNRALKIVYASTRQIYGRPRYLPVDEAHPVHPVDVNGVSKLAGEHFHLLFNDVYGVRTTVLRLTNTYGPGMRVKDARQMFVGVWIRRLLEGAPIPIFGDGAQIRDFTFVDDCVDALQAAALEEKTNGRVFNIGGQEPVALLKLAQMLVGLGYGGRIEMHPFPPERRAIDIGDSYSDYSSFNRECGWRPRIGLEEGLRRTVEFYRARLTEYL
jgi:UDP-glucose 4-epimerase